MWRTSLNDSRVNSVTLGHTVMTRNPHPRPTRHRPTTRRDEDTSRRGMETGHGRAGGASTTQSLGMCSLTFSSCWPSFTSRQQWRRRRWRRRRRRSQWWQRQRWRTDARMRTSSSPAAATWLCCSDDDDDNFAAPSLPGRLSPPCPLSRLSLVRSSRQRARLLVQHLVVSFPVHSFRLVSVLVRSSRFPSIRLVSSRFPSVRLVLSRPHSCPLISHSLICSSLAPLSVHLVPHLLGSALSSSTRLVLRLSVRLISYRPRSHPLVPSQPNHPSHVITPCQLMCVYSTRGEFWPGTCRVTRRGSYPCPTRRLTCVSPYKGLGMARLVVLPSPSLQVCLPPLFLVHH